MQIKEVEQLTGIDRANIRYYEKEGLLNPSRSENGYREYSEMDLETLKRIKLLRSLHVPIEDIKSIIEGKTNFKHLLSKQITYLEKENQDVSLAMEICRNLQRDQFGFHNLDAAKYLDQINESTEKTDTDYFKIKDELPQVYYPWRRFFARGLDLTLYSTLWSLFIFYAFDVNLISRAPSLRLVDELMAMLMMLLIEPFLLHQFRTTPGKAVFGLSLESLDGQKLTIAEGFKRTWGVILKGMALGIPLVNILTHLISYQRCRQGEPQPWDEDIAYRIKDRKLYRSLLYAAATASFVGMIFLVSYLRVVPPNKGDLTLVEFVENFNHFADLYEVDFGNRYLSRYGSWEEKKYDFRTSMMPVHLKSPDFRFTTKSGNITGVSFVVDIRQNDFWIESYDKYMLLSTLALATSEGSLWSIPDTAVHFSREFITRYFQTFELEEYGVKVKNEVRYEGYVDRDALLRADRSIEENSFYQVFSVDKASPVR